MLSKNKIKFISSLKQKKYRDQHGLFVVEGDKMISELLLSKLKIKLLAATREWISINDIPSDIEEIIEVSESELKKISFHKAPNSVFAIAEKQEVKPDFSIIHQNLSILLDNVQDPGNIGSIIRTADWYGIGNIFCTEECADIYNPKVVQSTMGSIFRVQVHYIDSLNLLNLFAKEKVPIYGTYLDGNNIYNERLSGTGLILFGNESKGLSKKYDKYVTNRISIPGSNYGKQGAESLNVSVATAVVCSEFHRRLNT